MIEQLKKFPAEPDPQPVTPRCQAVVTDVHDRAREWRAKRGYSQNAEHPFQCARTSVVKLAGKHYCRLHGGHKALDMAIKGELIEASE
jgi:hypothetical protein